MTLSMFFVTTGSHIRCSQAGLGVGYEKGHALYQQTSPATVRHMCVSLLGARMFRRVDALVVASVVKPLRMKEWELILGTARSTRCRQG
jgi:hypothetical protein